ncbi:MAG: hypothetical protein IT428_22190 [Planctomycetaceae bacterium]|nr:hypothetical protein [Planctomycetaceae bacterium]
MVFGLAWAFSLTAHRGLADGREFSATRHDLRVGIDTRWAGCRHGGYYPIRIRVTNTGVPRNLTFEFKPQEHRLPQVSRTVGIEQNATVQMTLSIPMVGVGNYGTLTLLNDGRALQGMSWDLSLPDLNFNEAIRPSVLVISPGNVDMTALESAVQARFNPTGSSSGRYGYSSSVSNDHQVVPPLMLPDSWLDYSGLDYVFVPLDVLNALPTGTRAAIIHWAETGGTLVVTKVGGTADQSEPLKRALGLESRAAAFRAWSPADVSARVKISLIPTEQIESAGGGGGSVEGQTEPARQVMASKFTWPESGEAYQTLRLMQGSVVAFPKDPFSGSARDWAWFLTERPSDASNWPERHGLSSRRGNSEFLMFDIPGLRGVPVYAFLTLITIFALAIGPVNYFILWKRKRLWMLVVTIPAIAFLTSATLFGYSTIAHGFSVRSRTRSITVLDQNSRDAVTTARTSLFAGLSPSRGLRYSPETAVYPVWSNMPDENGGLDWTDTQAFDSSWIRSRTRTQFVSVNHRTERGRLVIGNSDGTSLPVENGFPWAIESLVLAGADGRMYVGGPIPAGAGTNLTLMTDPQTQLAALNEALSRYPLKFPEGAASINMNSSYNRYRGGYYPGYGYDSGLGAVSFNGSRFEKLFASWRSTENAGPKLDARSYLAIFSENPGVEKGAEPVNEVAPTYALLGYY